MRKKKHVWCFFSGDILITVVLHPLMCKENIAAKKIKLTEKCGKANRLQSGEQDRKGAPYVSPRENSHYSKMLHFT